jgi:hypothetical protein
MRISSFYFIICVMVLSAILPGCDNSEFPPYTGVVINEPEEPVPPTAEDTIAFMGIASIAGTWQLISLGYDSIDYRDSAIFYTFTVDEYSSSASYYKLDDLRQKGELTIRRGNEEEASIPYEYFFAYYNDPSVIPLESTDYVPNIQLGDSVLYCLRGNPSYMSLHSVGVNPKYGNRKFSSPGFIFNKVE